MSATAEDKSLTSARKVAILLSVLGEDVAAEVFRLLDGEDLQRVADEVSNLVPVPVELSVRIFEEYLQRTGEQDYSAHGGLDLVKRLLFRALG